MKKIRHIAALVAFLFAAPALAQQVQNHAVPIGKGAGVTGFNAAAPGTAGQPLVSQGAAADPAFGTIGNAAFAVGPANTVKGTLDGASTVDVPLPSCTAVNSAWKYTSGIGINCTAITVTTGFDTPINMGLSASAGGGALTINVTQANGTAPSGSNPVLVPFRSLTATAGTVAYSTISSALSLTVPSGATLGTSSGNIPFRVWIFLTANGGTPSIGVAVCSTATNILPCASWEYTLKTTVAIGAGSTSSGVLYSSAAVVLDAVRIVGFCEFSGGLTTAGTWASACTNLQVMSPGVKKPGEVVQTIFTPFSALNTGATLIPYDDTIPQITEGDEYMSQAITPTATMNLIQFDAQGNFASTNNAIFTMALFRDAVAGSLGAVAIPNFTANLQATMNASTTVQALVAGTTTTMRVRAGNNGANTTTFNGISSARRFGGSSNSYIRLQEIMG